MINFDRFVARWKGRKCNFDPAKKFWGQCTQICKQWARENRWPIPNGGGRDALGFVNFTDGYRFIKNRLTIKPRRGDIIIWNIALTGHVGICSSANLLWMNVFEQNDPKNSACHKKKYLYTRCIGWLRKR